MILAAFLYIKRANGISLYFDSHHVFGGSLSRPYRPPTSGSVELYIKYIASRKLGCMLQNALYNYLQHTRDLPSCIIGMLAVLAS